METSYPDRRAASGFCPRVIVLTWLLSLACICVADRRAIAGSGPTLQVEVDARDLPRRLLHTRIHVPCKPGKLGLWYPKWIPGTHSPSGPIQDVAGLRLETPDGKQILKNDFVFALIGYHPDFEFLESLGVRSEGKDRLPICDPVSLESNVPGIYLAGVIVAGARTNEIFIENGRFHGRAIALDLCRTLGNDKTALPEPSPATKSGTLQSAE